MGEIFLVCVCVCAQRLFDVLPIFQTNCGEIACSNGLHEAQECRSTDEFFPAACNCLCVCVWGCEITPRMHTVLTHSTHTVVARKWPGYEPCACVSACLSQSEILSRVSCRVFGLCGAAWLGFNEPWTLSVSPPVSMCSLSISVSRNVLLELLKHSFPTGDQMDTSVFQCVCLVLSIIMYSHSCCQYCFSHFQRIPSAS